MRLIDADALELIILQMSFPEMCGFVGLESPICDRCADEVLAALRGSPTIDGMNTDNHQNYVDLNTVKILMDWKET